MIVGDAQLEPGLRIYAIGDIHGCIDQLRELLDAIDDDVRLFSPQSHRIVFLGDYVDRGPANFDVVEYLIGLKNSSRDCIFLRGNHDDRFTGFCKHPEAIAEGYLRWGGIPTLRDYGVIQEPGESIQSLSERFRNGIPAHHYQFMDQLPLTYVCGDYFFCHAGVRPGTALEDQLDHDLLWIRHDFLMHDEPFTKIVVHGHTPVEEPEVKSNRINVDTRCFDTGRLTAVVLEGNDHRFLQT